MKKRKQTSPGLLEVLWKDYFDYYRQFEGAVVGFKEADRTLYDGVSHLWGKVLLEMEEA